MRKSMELRWKRSLSAIAWSLASLFPINRNNWGGGVKWESTRLPPALPVAQPHHLLPLTVCVCHSIGINGLAEEKTMAERAEALSGSVYIPTLPAALVRWRHPLSIWYGDWWGRGPQSHSTGVRWGPSVFHSFDSVGAPPKQRMNEPPSSSFFCLSLFWFIGVCLTCVWRRQLIGHQWMDRSPQTRSLSFHAGRASGLDISALPSIRPSGSFVSLADQVIVVRQGGGGCGEWREGGNPWMNWINEWVRHFLLRRKTGTSHVFALTGCDDCRCSFSKKQKKKMVFFFRKWRHGRKHEPRTAVLFVETAVAAAVYVNNQSQSRRPKIKNQK